MPTPPFQGRLVIAGATGALGNEVTRLLVGLRSFEATHVLAREPITPGMRSVHTWAVAGDSPAQWLPLPAEMAVVMFEPPRMFYGRERALWTPQPQQLLPLAHWLRRGGIRTLAIVMPHAQMYLPESLRLGLATLDEQALAALDFERLLIVRSAQKPGAPAGGSLPARLAQWMLSMLRYMVPSRQQPVRAVKIAAFVAHALELAPAGIHVAAPETVWQAAQGDVRAAVADWLARRVAKSPGTHPDR
jgi:hypothetical protein